MHDAGIPGMSFAVIENNQIVYFKTYGYKHLGNKGPVNRRTIFEAASLSKSALTFVAYKLIEEGLLDLDKPMYKYLAYPPLEHDPRYKLITARMVLSHCSGIENLVFEYNPDTVDIVSNPGERWVYSGEGYVYLSKVEELLLHKPYDDYIRDMVFEPLGLKRSFTHYTHNGKYPRNYALPHNIFGKEGQKWKPSVAFTPGSMNMTAKDYAKIFLMIFNGKYLSKNSISEICRPVIQMDHANPDLFYGTGFELLFGNGDTIISHGGSTGGFKAGVYYSKVKKSGFVYLSNSDRGDIIVNRINQLTAGFDLQGFFKSDLFPEYPSDGCNLLKTYNTRGLSGMFGAVENLKKTGDSVRIVKALIEMGVIFLDKDTTTARRLLEDAVAYRYDSATTTYLLGEAYLASHEYKMAYDLLMKAKELHYERDIMDYDLKLCKQKMNATSSK